MRGRGTYLPTSDASDLRTAMGAGGGATNATRPRTEPATASPTPEGRRTYAPERRVGGPEAPHQGRGSGRRPARPEQGPARKVGSKRRGPSRTPRSPGPLSRLFEGGGRKVSSEGLRSGSKRGRGVRGEDAGTLLPALDGTAADWGRRSSDSSRRLPTPNRFGRSIMTVGSDRVTGPDYGGEGRIQQAWTPRSIKAARGHRQGRGRARP